MRIKNQVMLITYADSLGKDLNEMLEILNKHFSEAIGGVHLLPFYPSSADRGFAPMTYQEVDPAFGNWDEIRKISEKYYLMVDFMINHISKSSNYYKDFILKKDNSPYANLFLRYKDFWPDGEPTPQDIELIYKRKPRAPYVEAQFSDNTTEKIWCTFDEEQIDLNPQTSVTKQFYRENLQYLAAQGASIIRLDAFAYAIKKVGTNCFFVEPEIWEMLTFLDNILKPFDVAVLPEIHEHYTIQLKLAAKGYWVYDFALPMLILHALYSGETKRLAHWLEICPRNQFTTLDTHDGIGVVDVIGLLNDDEIDFTRETLYARGANVKRKYSSTEYNNLDIYQINCTYYSALGDNDDAYLLARAIQFFAPGIPQVYYVGLLAGANDLELLEKTKVGRNINRHFYTKGEVESNLERPVVKRLVKLMKFRNECQAFDRNIKIENSFGKLRIEREGTNGDKALLNADLINYSFKVTWIHSDGLAEDIII